MGLEGWGEDDTSEEFCISQELDEDDLDAILRLT